MAANREFICGSCKNVRNEPVVQGRPCSVCRGIQEAAERRAHLLYLSELPDQQRLAKLEAVQYDVLQLLERKMGLKR